MGQEKAIENFTLNFRISEDTPVNKHELEIFNYGLGKNETLCEVKEIDGVRVLNYTIPATLPLSKFMVKKFYKGEFLEILANIMRKLVFFEEHGMPLKKVLLNTQYMYINLETFEVMMVYMPVNKQFEDSNVCEFIQAFIDKLRFADVNSADCVAQLLTYLDSRMMFNLSDFYNFILDLEEENMRDDDITGNGETTVLSSAQYRNIVPHLVRQRTNELVTIEQETFKVGKSSECDYRILDNKKISRRHCTFVIRNGECYIKDDGSTNHTYVNGKLLQPGFEVMLKDDDYIRMADEEFRYWVK